MARQSPDLRTLLDIPQWEKVQDQLALLTGTAIITIDFKGTPITKHSSRTEFCSIIRENPIARKRCFRCDALAGLEAVRMGKPYIYLCHCGIVDVAVPVMVGERYLGAVMFGQVRLPQGDSEGRVKRLVSEISSIQEDSCSGRQDLMELYQRLPVMEYERIEQIAGFIASMVDYIIQRHVRSRNEAELYDWILRTGVESPIKVDERVRPLTSGLEPSAQESPVPQSSAVYPAVCYIHTHPGQSLSMNEMADLCHLSPSYFSRLFHREVGESFTDYVNRQKIQLAKTQLRSTTKSISQISAELGYVNTSHFINLFKRYEGITPSVYRQHRYK